MKGFIKLGTIFFSCILSSLMILGCAYHYSERGTKVLDKGNYKEAIQDFKACINNEGDTGELAAHCSFMLGKAYLDKGQNKEAVSYIKRAIDVYKKGMEDYKLNGAWYFWLGKAYYASKQYKEAIVNFDQAASIIPEDRQTFVNEFQRRSNAGQVKFWKQHLLALIPPKSSCYFWLGNAYYWNGQFSEAVNSHKKAIELDPQGSTHYFVMLGASYRELKQYDEALAAVKRAIEIKPDDFAYGVLGSIYERQNKMDEAIAARKKVIELNSQDVSNYFTLVKLYSRTEEYYKSIALLQEAQKVAPHNFNIPYALADMYARLGKFNEATAFLNNALKPLITPALKTDIGIIVIQENHPTVAAITAEAKGADIKAGDKVTKINGQPAMGFDLNKIAQKLQEPKEAQVTLAIERKGMDKVIERKFSIKKESIQIVEIIKKEAAGSLGFRSLIYGLKGDFEKATIDAKKAYSLEAHNEMTKRAISFAHILSSPPLNKEGKIAEALKILSTIKDSPFDRLLETLAYSKMGDIQKSKEIYMSIPEEYLRSKDKFREQFKKAVLESLAPYLENKREQVKTLEAKGQYREALKEYAELLKIADEKEAERIRNHVGMMIKNRPYLGEFPEEARKHILRAEVSTKEGKFGEAINEYKQASKLAPFFAQLYKALALNYAELKEYERAISNLKIYLDLSPDAPDARTAKDEIYKWEFMLEKEKEGK